ncbi:MAG: asparaginase [Burkholderiaceae bacterium]|nr:asparaginase [Burkholderiaceae bacterium]
MSSKIVLLGTGGTMAGTAADPADNVGYTAGKLGVAHLLAAVPALAGLPLVSEQVAQLDSKDMGFAVWQQLAARCVHHLAQPDVTGIVITHGTDTLEETAWFLQSVLAPAKPVVLTCAMRPATSVAADGPQNLIDAVAVASAPGARGVVAVCAGAIHSAADVQKDHPYRVDAFSSGDAGPVGYVEEGRLILMRNWPQAPVNWAKFAIDSGLSDRVWPRVDIVMNYAGVDGTVVDALLARGVDGIVVACTGNGTLHEALEAALLRAQAAGVAVVRATRCAYGRVLPQAAARLRDSAGLSPVKARVALLLELMAD